MALRPDKVEIFAKKLLQAGRVIYEDVKTGVSSPIELIRLRLCEGHVIIYLIRKPGCPFKQSQVTIRCEYICEEGTSAFLPCLGEQGARLSP